MKTLITLATLILTVNSAQAAGFQPWSDAAGPADRIDQQAAVVESAGFGPWRQRDIVDPIKGTEYAVEVSAKRELNIFRPWS